MWSKFLQRILHYDNGHVASVGVLCYVCIRSSSSSSCTVNRREQIHVKSYSLAASLMPNVSPSRRAHIPHLHVACNHNHNHITHINDNVRREILHVVRIRLCKSRSLFNLVSAKKASAKHKLSHVTIFDLIKM